MRNTKEGLGEWVDPGARFIRPVLRNTIRRPERIFPHHANTDPSGMGSIAVWPVFLRGFLFG